MKTSTTPLLVWVYNQFVTTFTYSPKTWHLIIFWILTILNIFHIVTIWSQWYYVYLFSVISNSSRIYLPPLYVATTIVPLSCLESPLAKRRLVFHSTSSHYSLNENWIVIVLTLLMASCSDKVNNSQTVKKTMIKNYSIKFLIVK